MMRCVKIWKETRDQENTGRLEEKFGDDENAGGLEEKLCDDERAGGLEDDDKKAASDIDGDSSTSTEDNNDSDYARSPKPPVENPTEGPEQPPDNNSPPITPQPFTGNGRGGKKGDSDTSGRGGRGKGGTARRRGGRGRHWLKKPSATNQGNPTTSLASSPWPTKEIDQKFDDLLVYSLSYS